MGHFENICFQRTLKTSSPCHSECFPHLEESLLNTNLHVFSILPCALWYRGAENFKICYRFVTDLKGQGRIKEHISNAFRWFRPHMYIGKKKKKSKCSPILKMLLACFKIYLSRTTELKHRIWLVYWRPVFRHSSNSQFVTVRMFLASREKKQIITISPYFCFSFLMERQYACFWCWNSIAIYSKNNVGWTSS